MDSNEEVKPTIQSEKVEVSSDSAPKPKFGTAVCCECGQVFDRSGFNQKRCKTCSNRPKEPKRTPRPAEGTPERLEYHRIANQKTQDRKKAQEAKDAAKVNYQVDLDEDRAREILTTERLIRHPHVLDVLIDLAKIAAQLLKIPTNEHLYRYGVQKTLAALESKEPATPVDPDMDRWEPGQRIRVHEQFAIFDFSISWRTQKDGTKISFERFQELRRICQTNTYEAGRQVHGKDFAEKPHKQWNDELFVHRNPDLLPEEYGHSELSQAMAAQSPIRRRILLAARNSLKTTMDIYDICGWICTFHDCRYLLCSSTNPLSKSLIKLFRQIFIIRDPLLPSLFQQLWPELCVSDATSVQNYLCPMRALDFPEPTLQATSAESSGQAGMRASHIVYEDVCEFSNVTTPDQRQKVIEVYSLLNELLDPSGFIMICGTAWGAPTADGGCGDLYYEILKEENDKPADEKQFKVVIAPCWKVKGGVRKEAYDISLTEDEVELMYPERLTFQWIKSKLGKTAQKIRTFRQQQLVQWVEDESENLRIQFDPDVLSAAVIGSGAVPLGTTVLSVDIAYSLTSKADRTAIAAVRIHENMDKQKCMTVLDVVADQMRGSELCEKLARMCRQYSPSVVLIEKGPTADHLRALIDATAAKFEVSIPARFVQTSNVKNIKFQKLKDLELLISQKRCRFKGGEYVNALFEELQRIDGTRSSSRRDDRGDAISQVASVFKIYSTESSKEQAAEDANEVEKMERKAALQAEMQRYLGGSNYTPPPKVEQPAPAPQPAPRFPSGAGNFNILPPGMRGINRR
jgi:hypothetical protein